MKAKKFDAAAFFGRYGILIVFVLMVVVLAFASDTFFTVKNGLNVLRQVSINGILAMGMTLIIITGGIDLSVGAVLALAAVAACTFAHPEPLYPVILIVVISLVVGLICGVLNGVLVAWGAIPPFIATLGTTMIARGAALVYTDGRSVITFSDQFKFLGQGFIFGIPVPVFFFALVILLTYIILHKSKLGRHIYAVGGNEMAAKASGIYVPKVKCFVYCYSGILCGLAGLILASRTAAATPNAGTAYETDAIAATVLGGASMAGGKGRVTGTILGALILGVISNGLDIMNVSSYIQQIVKGCIIIAAVYFDKVTQR